MAEFNSDENMDTAIIETNRYGFILAIKAFIELLSNAMGLITLMNPKTQTLTYDMSCELTSNIDGVLHAMLDSFIKTIAKAQLYNADSVKLCKNCLISTHNVYNTKLVDNLVKLNEELSKILIKFNKIILPDTAIQSEFIQIVNILQSKFDELEKILKNNLELLKGDTIYFIECIYEDTKIDDLLIDDSLIGSSMEPAD